MAIERLPILDDDDKIPVAFLPTLDAADVGADPSGTAANAIADHAGDTDPHGDRAAAALDAQNRADAAQTAAITASIGAAAGLAIVFGGI